MGDGRPPLPVRRRRPDRRREVRGRRRHQGGAGCGGEGARGRGAVLGVLGGARRDHGVERGGEIAPEVPQRGHGLVDVAVHDGRGVARERVRPAEQLEQDAGHRVDVGRATDGLVQEALGRHVADRADGEAGPGQPPAEGRAGGARDAEVDQGHELRRPGGDQHVPRLDVAVDQALGVGGVQRGGELLDDRDGPVRRHRAVAPQQRAEVEAVDEAHLQEEPAVQLAVVVHGDDVRLAQLRHDLRLAAEPRAVLGVARQVCRQQLQGHEAIVLAGVAGPVDLAHPATTQEAVQPVRPEHRLDHGSPFAGEQGAGRVVPGEGTDCGDGRTAGTPCGVPAVRVRGAGVAVCQPCLTSVSVLLKMLFPLDGSVGVPLSITPVRFFQIVLPASANGPSLSTYTP